MLISWQIKGTKAKDPEGKRAKRVYHLRMENHGFFEGCPKSTLTNEQASAMFRANQKDLKLTRVPGDQFDLTRSKPPPSSPLPKKRG